MSFQAKAELESESEEVQEMLDRVRDARATEQGWGTASEPVSLFEIREEMARFAQRCGWYPGDKEAIELDGLLVVVVLSHEESGVIDPAKEELVSLLDEAMQGLIWNENL